MAIPKRFVKATELMRLAVNGPDMSWVFSDLPNEAAKKHANEYANDAYRIWSETWLLPLIRELVPEASDITIQRRADKG